MKKRIISLLMILALVFTMLPVYALGDAVAEGSGVTDSQGTDIKAIVEQIKALIAGGGDISDELGRLLEGLNADTIADILKQLGGDSEAIKAILDKLGELDKDKLTKIIESIISGGGDIGGIIPDFGDADIGEIITAIVGGNDQISEILKNIPIKELVEAVKALINGGSIGDVLPDLNDDEVAAIIAAIIENVGGGDISDIIGNADTAQLIEIIKALVNGDIDISQIISDLGTDKIAEIIMGLIGDNDTISEILGKLDTDKLIEVIKAIINGGGNISGIIGNLDAYTLLKVIAGLIGSDLDVTGPNDVTVAEGETAKFSVKVAGSYKYMWLEPAAVKGLDLGGVDLTGSTIEIATKLFQALRKAALSTTDTLELKNVAASDNGRTFACVIYNIALNDTTLFVTDEAKLTVNASQTCKHVKVVDTPAVDATCTKDGRTEGSHCSVCNAVLSVSTVIKATGHDYGKDGIQCKNCGEYAPFPFVDVAKTAWYRGDVEYVWKHGIMKGISGTEFAPDLSANRAMFVTVIYRMEGSPSVKDMPAPAFTDIVKGTWYYDAVVWAANVGITKGTSATTFAPDEAITRAQIVTMLYRYSQAPGVSGALKFGDASAIGQWAHDAVLWASSIGIVNGYPNGNFGPNDTTKRCEMAAILHRYMELSKIV